MHRAPALHQRILIRILLFQQRDFTCRYIKIKAVYYHHQHISKKIKWMSKGYQIIKILNHCLNHNLDLDDSLR